MEAFHTGILLLPLLFRRRRDGPASWIKYTLPRCVIGTIGYDYFVHLGQRCVIYLGVFFSLRTRPAVPTNADIVIWSGIRLVNILRVHINRTIFRERNKETTGPRTRCHRTFWIIFVFVPILAWAAHEHTWKTHHSTRIRNGKFQFFPHGAGQFTDDIF